MVMRGQIERPMAHAVVSWRSEDERGHRSGLPTAPVYMATAVFPLGGEREEQPGWPAAADKFSVLLQAVSLDAAVAAGLYKVDFLLRDQVWPFLHQGAEMLVAEGPKVVATAVILEVHTEEGGAG